MVEVVVKWRRWYVGDENEETETKGDEARNDVVEGVAVHIQERRVLL